MPGVACLQLVEPKWKASFLSAKEQRRAQSPNIAYLEQVHLKRNPLAKQAANQMESADRVITEGWRHRMALGASQLTSRLFLETHRLAHYCSNWNQQLKHIYLIILGAIYSGQPRAGKKLSGRSPTSQVSSPISLNKTQEQNRRHCEAWWKVTAAALGD